MTALPRCDWTTLWLPIRARGPLWLATAVVGVIYLLTMSRDLSFYDSPELALVAWQGGLSHPLGQPLHAILGWIAAHIPGVPALIGLNALSALPAALSVIPAASLAETIAGDDPPPGNDSRWFRRRYVVPIILVVIALHGALWESATRVEVYALAGFFALWSVAQVAHLLSSAHALGRQWLAPGITFGLAASSNPVVAAIAAVSLLPWLAVSLIKRRMGLRHALGLLGGGVAGLLPFLYVPLVAGRQDAFVWGAPTGGTALHRYFTGADYAHNQGATLAVIAQHAADWLGWATRHSLLPILVLGLAGHLIWGGQVRRDRWIAVINFGLTLLFISMNVIFYPDVTDYLGYLMPSFWLLAAGTAVLVYRLGLVDLRRRVLACLVVAALAVLVVLAPPPVFSRARHHDRVARVLAQGALDAAPRNAVIIASSDHWVFPLLYLQEAEDRRPDVAILPRGLSGASWYWAHLLRRHPDLQSFPLRGRGGQPARIRRFLAANPDRPVLYASWREAVSIGRRPTCVGSWLLRDGSSCEASPPVSPVDALTPALERELSTVGFGSPTTDAVIANVALTRGEMLWRLGHNNAALRAFRAGVPQQHRPPLPGSARAVAAAPPLTAPQPNWSDDVAIGHYSRNLVMAARLLSAGGHDVAARRHLAAAVEAGFTTE